MVKHLFALFFLSFLACENCCWAGGDSIGNTLGEEREERPTVELKTEYLTSLLSELMKASGREIGSLVNRISKLAIDDVEYRNLILGLFDQVFREILAKKHSTNWALLEQMLRGLVRIHTQIVGTQPELAASVTPKIFEMVSFVHHSVHSVDDKGRAVRRTQRLEDEQSRIDLFVRVIELFAEMSVVSPQVMFGLLPHKIEYNEKSFENLARLSPTMVEELYEAVLYLTYPAGKFHQDQQAMLRPDCGVLESEKLFWKLHMAVAILSSVEVHSGIIIRSSPLKAFVVGEKERPLGKEYLERIGHLLNDKERGQNVDLISSAEGTRTNRGVGQNLEFKTQLFTNRHSNAELIEKYRSRLRR